MPRKSTPPPAPPRLCEDNSTLKWYGATLNRSATVTGPTVQVAGGLAAQPSVAAQHQRGQRVRVDQHADQRSVRDAVAGLERPQV